jgi:hypothetical protein
VKERGVLRKVPKPEFVFEPGDLWMRSRRCHVAGGMQRVGGGRTWCGRALGWADQTGPEHTRTVRTVTRWVTTSTPASAPAAS